MKIFTKSVVEEYTIGALLIFVSLLAIAGVTLLVRYLGQAASGAIPVTSIFMFLILSVAKYLPTLVNLSVFLGITVCLMRVYRESEMIIWLSSGRSIFSWLSPTVRFLIPMLILSAIFSFILAPWADGKRDELKRKIENTEDISVLSEGEFIGSSDGKRIFYVDKIMQNGTLSSAFVFSENDEEKTITVSERGTQRGTPLGTFIILDSGRAYRFYKETGDIDLTSFDEEGIRLQSKSADRDLTPHGALQTNLLFLKAIEGDRAAKAEMIDRAAYPISLFFLALLSIPIARRRVRSSKNFAIANAILFFFLYQNLIAIFNLKVVTGETSTLQGIFPSWPGCNIDNVAISLEGRYFSSFGIPFGSTMKMLTIHIFRRIFGFCLGILLALTCLFLFFDFIQEMSGISASTSGWNSILMSVLLGAPDRIYELSPLSVLVGSLMSFSSFSQASEYVVIRASGGSVKFFLRILMLNGFLFAALAFCIGEFLSPITNRISTDMKVSQMENKLTLRTFASGYWLKDGNTFINIKVIESTRLLRGVSIFAIGENSQIRNYREAEYAEYLDGGGWVLKNTEEVDFLGASPSRKKYQALSWITTLEPPALELIGIARNQMSLMQLAGNIRYLEGSGQNFNIVESILWAKISHPLTVLTLALLGFVAAELQSRSRSLGLVLFVGVIGGVGIYFLNKFIFSIGRLSGWLPQIYAILPILVILAVTSAWIYKKELR